MDMAECKKDCLTRLQGLIQERNVFDAHWKAIARVTAPRSVRFVGMPKGNRTWQDIYDNTAPFAVRTLASGMMAGLTSPARPWFRLSVNDTILAESAAVKSWLFEVESSMRNVFNSSNFYQTLPILYQQLGSFGTAAQIILEDAKDVIRCHPFPLGTYYLTTDASGRVNGTIRKYQLTVGQVVQKFGIENCSDEVVQNFNTKKLDIMVDVIHSIMPNPGRDTHMLDNRNKPFLSMNFEQSNAEKNEKCLDCSGFDDFPVQAPRWEVTGEDVYGCSCPGMIALSDILMLQRAVKLRDKITNKIVDPPLIADAMLRGQQISMLNGAITYISGLATAAGAGARPMHEIRADVLMPLDSEIQRLQAAIRQAFFSDMMQMFAISDNSQMTAREVEERHQEKLLILGPVMERMNSELLDPAIHRTYKIMERKGLIPPLPPELHGKPIQIEYVSIMASAQKMIGTASIERLFGFVGNIAASKPEVLDKLDFDHAVDEMAAMLGTSPKVVLADDKVKGLRDIRAKQMQQQQQAAQMSQMAPAMQQGADAARLLSETGVGDSTALNRLLGV